MKARILELNDRGETPAQIALTLSLAPGAVYATLRAERPARKRAPRRLVSPVPAKVRALAGAGVKVARIAGLLRVSRAYVYRILKESK